MRYLLLASAIMLPVAAGAAADGGFATLAASGAEPVVASPGNAFEGLQEARVINPVPTNCPSIAERAAEKRGRPLRADRLTDLPPGEAFHAVYRLDSNGCPDPVLVGYPDRSKRKAD